ncbi:jg6732, partial [Pararge aegeria aegeria]
MLTWSLQDKYVVQFSHKDQNGKWCLMACARISIDPSDKPYRQSSSDRHAGRTYAWMGELQYPGAPSVDDDRQYRAPFRRAPQYRWGAPQPPQPSAFAPWRRAPAPPRPPDYRRTVSYPGKPDEPYQ